MGRIVINLEGSKHAGVVRTIDSPLVVSTTFLPSATALLAASLASPAARDTFDSSLSKASMAEFLALFAVGKKFIGNKELADWFSLT